MPSIDTVRYVNRGFGGLNTRDSELTLPDEDSPGMRNMDLHPPGATKKRQGTTALGSPDGEDRIDALFRLNQPVDGEGWIYAMAGNTIYRTEDPGSWSWEETPATPIAITDMNERVAANSRYYNGATEYPAVLYIPRIDAAPLISLGLATTTGDVIVMPAGAYGSGGAGTGTQGYPTEWSGTNWPTHMRMMDLGRGSRMFAWGCPDDPDTVYYSEINVPWNFLRSNVDDPSAAGQPNIDGGYFHVRLGDGDEIVTVQELYGYKLIGKRHTSALYAGDPGYVDDGDWNQVAEFPVGFANDSCAQKVGNEILFWSDDGARILSAVQEYGDLAPSEASYKIEGLTSLVLPSGYDRIRSVHDIENRRVIWYVPTVGATNTDAAYVFYYATGRWSVWSGPATELVDVLVLETDVSNSRRYIAGTAENGVTQLFAGYSDANIDEGTGDDVEAYYETDWIVPTTEASRAMWLDVIYGDGGAEVDIEFRTDLDLEWSSISRIIKSFGGGGSYWGGGMVWGTSAWGAVAQSYVRYEFDEQFTMVAFRFKKTGTLPFEIMKYRLGVYKDGAWT